jgi:Family of unknown function (DUF6338)
MPTTVTSIIVLAALVLPGLLFQEAFSHHHSIGHQERDLYVVVQAVGISVVLVALFVALPFAIAASFGGHGAADALFRTHRSHPDVLQAVALPAILPIAFLLGDALGRLAKKRFLLLRPFYRETEIDKELDKIGKFPVSYVRLLLRDGDAIVGTAYPGDARPPQRAGGIFLRRRWILDEAGEWHRAPGVHVSNARLLRIHSWPVDDSQPDSDLPPPQLR